MHRNNKLISLIATLLLILSTGGSFAQQQQCGQANIIAPRLSGSFPALNTDFPWLVRIKDNLNDSNFCVGVIIASEWILTTASCFNELKNVGNVTKIIAGGGVMLNETSDKQQVVTTDQIVKHPNFNEKNVSSDFDFALLHLNIPLKMYNRTDVMPICLLNDCNAEQSPTSLCFAAGWATMRLKYADNVTSTDNRLQKTVLPLVNRTVCAESLANSSTNGIVMSERMICAGWRDGGDDCQGDPGAPLICRSPGASNRYFLHGLDSVGFGCSRPHHIFSRPCSVMGWINSTLETTTLTNVTVTKEVSPQNVTSGRADVTTTLKPTTIAAAVNKSSPSSSSLPSPTVTKIGVGTVTFQATTMKPELMTTLKTTTKVSSGKMTTSTTPVKPTSKLITARTTIAATTKSGLTTVISTKEANNVTILIAKTSKQRLVAGEITTVAIAATQTLATSRASNNFIIGNQLSVITAMLMIGLKTWISSI